MTLRQKPDKPVAQNRTDSEPPEKLMDRLLDSAYSRRSEKFWMNVYQSLLPIRQNITEHIYGDREKGHSAEN